MEINVYMAVKFLSVISVRNLNIAFSEKPVFSDLSFDIEAKEKVSLIGANGAGKTTIFKILTGETEPDSGEISVSREVKIGYMNQYGCIHPNRTIYEEMLSVFQPVIQMEKRLKQLECLIDSKSENIDSLINEQAQLIESHREQGGLVYKSRINSALLGLGFSNDIFNMATGKLSGGQRSKLSLAKLLLSKANFLLLDEPTNHLDISSIDWLEHFINEFNGTALIISHDRFFLDRVTTKTIEIEYKKSICYIGNYSVYMIKKDQIRAAQLKKYTNDLKEINRIEKIVEQQKRWGREKNLITAESKQKQADRIKDQLTVPENEREKIKINFSAKNVSGSDVLICENLSKSFKGKNIFSDVHINIRKGERVFIIGPNGCGKTTLLKVIMSKYMQDSGTIRLGTGVSCGYFDQMQDTLSPEKSAYDEISDTFPQMTQTEVRTYLGMFLFKEDEVFKQIGKMSGGERARIAILKLMLGEYNLLLLDEPTNHLDIDSRENLEQTLVQCDKTLLIISHDRYFINKLADRVLELTSKGVKEYIGNYDDYLEKSQRYKENREQDKQRAETTKPLNDYQRKKEMLSQERRKQTALKKAEERITDIESEIEKIKSEMASKTVMSDYEILVELTNRLTRLQSEERQAYEEWLEMSFSSE